MRESLVTELDIVQDAAEQVELDKIDDVVALHPQCRIVEDRIICVCPVHVHLEGLVSSELLGDARPFLGPLANGRSTQLERTLT